MTPYTKKIKTEVLKVRERGNPGPLRINLTPPLITALDQYDSARHELSPWSESDRKAIIMDTIELHRTQIIEELRKQDIPTEGFTLEKRNSFIDLVDDAYKERRLKEFKDR
jgi:hypothetical protein